MKEKTLVIGDGSEATWELVTYLAGIIPIPNNTGDPNWEKDVIRRYPDMGRFYIEGMKRNTSLKPDDVKIAAVPPLMSEIRAPIEPFLSSIATGIGLVCSAGGTALLVDTIKTWVERKKGRRIRIKRGDVEVEIEGSVTQQELEQLIDMFNKHFKKIDSSENMSFLKGRIERSLGAKPTVIKMESRSFVFSTFRG